MTRPSATIIDQGRSRRTAAVASKRVSTASGPRRTANRDTGRAPDDRPQATLGVRWSRSAHQDPGAQLAALARAFSDIARGRLPTAWRAPGFAREVDLVRLHLRPLTAIALLAGSFGRESFNVGRLPDETIDGHRLLSTSATHVAYALRWMELRGDLALPTWAELNEADKGPSRPTLRSISALFTNRKPAENVDPAT